MSAPRGTAQSQVPKLRPEDEVTLVATVTLRYSATRMHYRDPGEPLPTDEQMAAIDQEQFDDNTVSVEDVLSWSDGPQNVTVRIEVGR